MSAACLTRPFPTKARIGGQEWPIRWQFRHCLSVILAFEDEELTPAERNYILLHTLYPQIPPDEERGLELALRFLDGGEPEEQREPGEQPPLRLYSFTRDGGLIYSAFRSQYGIDLQREELHWWAFLSLFQDLSADCLFYRLLHLRQGYLEGTLSREEEELLDRMGPSALPPRQPGDRAKEEAAKRFLTELEGGVGYGG